MCGICGFIGKKENKEQILKDMMRVMKHRGPDSEGVYCTEDVALGFCRLSIIDLADGTQPMANEKGDMTLVFNGEIYNYQSLRKELEQAGHTFATHSDSETLLHGFEEHREGLLEKVRGMFAFGIWEESEKRFFAARDFFGIKPFYYAVVEGCFVFASEIKSILQFPGFQKKVNEEALEQYLSFQYSALTETFFEGIYKLPPGTYLTYEEKILKICRYFDPILEPAKQADDQKTMEALDSVILDSIEHHMVSDVEVGAFLSSGVDSSLIAAKFSGNKAFTVGFLDKHSKYNETQPAADLAEHLKLEHYTKNITQEEYWEAVPKVMYHLDEPSGDAAAVALYFVAQEAAKQVKVVTSGEGADELFGGYNIYLEPDALHLYQCLPEGLRRWLGQWAQKLPSHIRGRNFLIRGSKPVEERFIGNANIFSAEERQSLLKSPTGALSPHEFLEKNYRRAQGLTDMEKMQYIDLTCWLPGDILQKADKMSMAHSLELRVPFLDRNVFDMARKLNKKEKVRSHKTKYLFRQVAARYLPAVSADKKKLGFPVPIRVWLREEEGYQKVRERFTSQAAEQYFKGDKLMNLLDEHKKGEMDNSRKIWTVYAFLIWHQVFFESGDSEVYAAPRQA